MGVWTATGSAPSLKVISRGGPVSFWRGWCSQILNALLAHYCFIHASSLALFSSEVGYGSLSGSGGMGALFGQLQADLEAALFVDAPSEGKDLFISPRSLRTDRDSRTPESSSQTYIIARENLSRDVILTRSAPRIFILPPVIPLIPCDVGNKSPFFTPNASISLTPQEQDWAPMSDKPAAVADIFLDLSSCLPNSPMDAFITSMPTMMYG